MVVISSTGTDLHNRNSSSSWGHARIDNACVPTCASVQESCSKTYGVPVMSHTATQ
jgi:hypothetical protein